MVRACRESGYFSSNSSLLLSLYILISRLAPIQNTETLENWAIEIDLSGDFVFSWSISTISFQVDGERAGDEGDLYFGFGDGRTYITVVVDFDGMSFLRLRASSLQSSYAE